MRGKLDRIKGLGEESSDEDDASKWIEKQRKKVAAKEAAEKRAKELEELDNEFGVDTLVTNTLKEDRQKEYDSKNLKGLKVGRIPMHDLIGDFRSGTVLRLLERSQLFSHWPMEIYLMTSKLLPLKIVSIILSHFLFLKGIKTL